MDDDQELAAIRARRMAELQRQHGGNINSGGPSDPNAAAAAAAQQKEKEDEFRHTILSQILSQEAGARLNTLKAVKPEMAKMVEDILIQNARMGRFNGKLSEDDLKGILTQISSRSQRETKVNIQRRAIFDSDDEDDY